MRQQLQTEDLRTIEGARTLPVDELGRTTAAAIDEHPDPEHDQDQPPVEPQDVDGQLRTLAAGAALAAVIGGRQPGQVHRAIVAGAGAEQVRAALGVGRLAVAEQWRQWADPRRYTMSVAEYEQVGRELYGAVRPGGGESTYRVRCPWCHRSADVDMMGGATRYECPEDRWSWTPDADQPYSLLADEFLDSIDPYERENEGPQ